MVRERSERLVLWSVSQVFCILFISRVKSVVSLSRNGSHVERSLEDVPWTVSSSALRVSQNSSCPISPLSFWISSTFSRAFTRAKLPYPQGSARAIWGLVNTVHLGRFPA